MRRCARSAGALLTFAALGAAAAPPPPGTVACRLSGWSEVRGAQMRAGPSPDARLLATFSPRASRQGGVDITGTFPEFEIRGYNNGWFLIGGASYGDYGDPEPRRPLYSGEGWMRGDQIGGQLGWGRLHSRPSERSSSRPYGKAPDAVRIHRLLACQDTWVRIEADIGTGWAPGMCGNQATTCG